MTTYNKNQGNKKDALKDYVEVNVRIEKFWADHPEGRINTEIVSLSDGVVVMKASVYKNISDAVPASTGFAYEKEGSSFINKTSFIENCETSAIGRALAIMGYEIKKSIASFEEVANAKLQQEIKKESFDPFTEIIEHHETETKKEAATQKQINLMKMRIREFAQKRNMEQSEFENKLMKNYGLNSLDEVDKKTADVIIKNCSK